MTTKTAKKTYGVRLEKRDFLILSALETWGVLGLGQIIGLAFRKFIEPQQRARYFFNETPRREYSLASYKRLTQLEKSGFIRAHHYIHLPKIYTLADAGHRVLKQRGFARLPGFRGSVSDSLISHELHVSAVGLILTQMMGLTVRTEQERYVWSGRGGWSPAPERYGISDLWVSDPAKPKAIEVEMTQKSKLRYAAIWDTYRNRMPIGGAVLYLTHWPAGPRCILAHAARFQADFIYVCSLREFRDSCGRAPFMGYEKGRRLALKRDDRPTMDALEGRAPAFLSGGAHL